MTTLCCIDYFPHHPPTVTFFLNLIKHNGKSEMDEKCKIYNCTCDKSEILVGRALLVMDYIPCSQK